MFEIGNSLRDARVRQGLELADARARDEDPPKYLRALEEEQFDSSRRRHYVKGFLRTYAEYLGLDGQLYVDEYNSRYVTRRGAECRRRTAEQPRAARTAASSRAVSRRARRHRRRARHRGLAARRRSRATGLAEPAASRRRPACAEPAASRVRARRSRDARDERAWRCGGLVAAGQLLWSRARREGREQSFQGKLWLYVQRPSRDDLVVANGPQRTGALLLVTRPAFTAPPRRA